MNSNNKITLIAAINKWSVAEQNLLRSPLLQTKDVQFIPAEGFASASQAYNHGIREATGNLLIFVHQDVYIPTNWKKQLLESITIVENLAEAWAVLGVIGVDKSSSIKGLCWSTGIGREVGTPVREPERTVSLDELILVVNKRSGLFFDDNLPGWHLYGTDIVQSALEQKLGAYVIHAPLIHNSLPCLRYDAGFAECYRYLRHKWAQRLPVKTCCTKLTRFGWPFIKARIRQMLVAEDKNTYKRLKDPVAKANELGYE